MWTLTKRECFLLVIVFAALLLPSVHETVSSSIATTSGSDVGKNPPLSSPTTTNNNNQNHIVSNSYLLAPPPIKGKKEDAEKGLRLRQSQSQSLQDDNDETTTVLTLNQPTSRGLFSNSHEVVHVIHTRLTQHQKALVNLAQARLDVFQTLTLPSVLQQTSPEFLWLLWIDPLLDTQIRRNLILLLDRSLKLTSIPTLVLGSRAKLPNFRDDGAFYDDLRESQVYWGDYEWLMDYKEAAQSRTVLTTVLDADDAIFSKFVETVQAEAARTLASPLAVQGDFRLWCAKETLIWRYYDDREDEETERSSPPRGRLIRQKLGHDKECPTGAYTVGYAPRTTVDDLPPVPRHQLHTTQTPPPSCEFFPHKCLSRFKTGNSATLAVLRAQTPVAVSVASALPRDMVVTKTSRQQQKDDDDDTPLWNKLQSTFGIQPSHVSELWARLEANMLDTLLDSEKGICTEGHSCKRTDKEAIIALKARYRNRNKEQLGQDQHNQFLLLGDYENDNPSDTGGMEQQPFLTNVEEPGDDRDGLQNYDDDDDDGGELDEEEEVEGEDEEEEADEEDLEDEDEDSIEDTIEEESPWRRSRIR